ncbi:MAG: heavy-metal-associated domain-containing protein [Candidatus Saccharibacteria bacterium]|nr:heavy-metal-associated domain-containing protein [Pseudorhodobacter sp.]
MDTMVSNMIELSIKGMTCSGCTNAVGRALRKVPGVTDVSVDLEAGRAWIVGTAAKNDLVAAVENSGFDVMESAGTVAMPSSRKGGCCCG